MSNVLSEEEKQSVIALGRLGWPLRRIEEATGIRRETASKYLKAQGIAVRPPRRRTLPDPASEVITDPSPDSKPASEVITDPSPVSEPASEVITDSDPALVPWPPTPGRSPRASACEPYREVIESW